MEIKRTFEMVVAAKRRYVIRQAAPDRQFVCAKCGEAMLTAEQAAGFFDITQRRIFQIIEIGAAHFAEAEAGAAMICIASLAEFLNGEMRLAAKIKSEDINES